MTIGPVRTAGLSTERAVNARHLDREKKMGRVAVVTGGTRGIGAAISVALKNAGYTVAANYGGNEDVARAFTAETGIPAYKFDVAAFDAVKAGMDKIAAELGPIDIVVNNAGITRDTTFHKMTDAQWDDVIRTNLGSCFAMSRAVIEGMRDRGFGRIIGISSVNGQRGQYGQVNYAAAKAGMIGFTKALALENARKGVTVNCIAPGYIDTDMVAAVPEKVLEGIIAQIPVGRLGRGEEIADMVAFLAGERAGYVTGTTLSLNGGQYLVG
jgi:acetoacetyl-CoA reductase